MFLDFPREDFEKLLKRLWMLWDCSADFGFLSAVLSQAEKLDSMKLLYLRLAGCVRNEACGETLNVVVSEDIE